MLAAVFLLGHAVAVQDERADEPHVIGEQLRQRIDHARGGHTVLVQQQRGVVLAGRRPLQHSVEPRGNTQIAPCALHMDRAVISLGELTHSLRIP